MIVTLAGHVDHGKTTLVKALTGVNTDRLSEERKRGLTIDLGFAYRRSGDQVLGFVDVPGHHRFVHNMIAGVASRQTALLVIAADDGPMPQTREHLQILKLIGVRRGVIALSKCDRVDDARIRIAREEIRALAAGSFLEEAPVIETRLGDNAAIDALHDALLAAEDETLSPAGEGFRLAIDRAFNVRGSGAVVTGTVHSGSLSVGDSTLISPDADIARVRGLRAQDTDVTRVGPGDRAAINLAGIDSHGLSRGQWLCDPDLHNPGTNLTVELSVLEDYPKAIRHWLPVHAYLGTSHRQAHVGLLTPGKLPPGESALADIILDSELDARIGDVVILRDHGLDRTIGGGRVIWTDQPGRRRRLPSRLARLQLAATTSPSELASRLLDKEAVDLPLVQRLINRQGLIELPDTTALRNGLAVTNKRWQSEMDRQSGLLERANTLTRRQLLADASDEELGKAALDELLRQGAVIDKAGTLSLASAQPSLDPFARSLLDRLTPHLDSDAPMSLGDIAARLKMSSKELSDAVKPIEQAGALIRVSPTRLMLPERLSAFEATARVLAADAPFSVRQFCDSTGLGRNAAIEVLEWLDKTGVTMRRDNVRLLRPGG